MRIGPQTAGDTTRSPQSAALQGLPLIGGVEEEEVEDRDTDSDAEPRMNRVLEENDDEQLLLLN